MEAMHAGFGPALEALDTGDVAGLKSLLDNDTALVAAVVVGADPPYDGYFHRATLLHHVAGNPIRGDLPDTIVEIRIERRTWNYEREPDDPDRGTGKHFAYRWKASRKAKQPDAS